MFDSAVDFIMTILSFLSDVEMYFFENIEKVNLNVKSILLSNANVFIIFATLRKRPLKMSSVQTNNENVSLGPYKEGRHVRHKFGQQFVPKL